MNSIYGLYRLAGYLFLCIALFSQFGDPEVAVEQTERAVANAVVKSTAEPVVMSIRTAALEPQWELVSVPVVETVPEPTPPCSSSIKVMLGEVDERFQISREELEGEVREAADFWSDAIGQPVVVYDDQEGIPIHFIYEDQQELTDQERELRERIERADDYVVSLERGLRQKERVYQQETAAYEVDSSSLARRIDQLNQWVRKVNDKGGFNEDELRQYHYRKQGVDQSAENLEDKQQWLVEYGFEISELVVEINRLIEEKNQLIDEYNVRFSGVHYLTQGVYEWNATDRVIQVLQFGGREELKLVLAHEIGHALGIDHLEDENAVMYRTIGNRQRSRLQVTDSDIAALRDACSAQSR